MSVLIPFRQLLISMLALFLSVSPALANAPDVFKEQGVTVQTSRPFPATQYIPDHDFDTRHIALDLRFDWDKERLLGRETLTFAPLVMNLKTVKLDAANITPTAVKITSRNNTAPQNLQFTIDAPKEKVMITLDRVYQPADELTLTIDYHTNGPQDPGQLGLVGVGLRFLNEVIASPVLALDKLLVGWAILNPSLQIGEE